MAGVKMPKNVHLETRIFSRKSQFRLQVAILTGFQITIFPKMDPISENDHHYALILRYFDAGAK